ncbi:MAG: glycosyltransferase [Planctomycetia bacterium]|nr:glycosyltransferase [Planctomycetia bacterium]
MHDPEIALLLSTYQRPAHLRRALESIALQSGVAGRFELIVADDGSTDNTPQIVAEFASSVPFRVGFTTHPHTTFRLSRSRNEGVQASRAPYLLFLDADCILPRDHVRIHLERRKPGTVMAGDCCRLDQETSAGITRDVIRGGQFQNWGPKSEIRRLRKLDRSARFYCLIRHRTKPKLIGNNVGIWRADYERVNGYDENFQGWGCEDDDLRLRLRRAGVRIESILRWTRTYHLWHPTDVTLPADWRKGANVNYLLRKGRLTRCRNGLHKRDLNEISIHVIGEPSKPHLAEQLIQGRFKPRAASKPEVEILFLPGRGRFSGQAECNVLVALEAKAAKSHLARQAHLMIAPGEPADQQRLRFPLEQFELALGSVA